MARMNKMSVQKRLRERKKAEKAAMKREERTTREHSPEPGTGEPTPEDLEGYGFGPASPDEAEDS